MTTMNAFVGDTVRPISAFKQWRSLTRAEFTLLRRNALQVSYAVAMPLVVPLMFLPMKDLVGSAGLGALVTMILTLGLIFVSFYNTLSAVVNRREDQVLTRLRAGEVRDWTILAALSSPGLFLGLLMSVGMMIVSIVALALSIPANIPLLAVAIMATVVLFLLLGLATAAKTRTAESAQITSLPVMLLLTIGPAVVSLGSFIPDYLVRIAEFIPTTAMTHVVSIAWFGGDMGSALKPLAIILGWIVLTAVFVKRSTRWSKRG